MRRASGARGLGVYLTRNRRLVIRLLSLALSSPLLSCSNDSIEVTDPDEPAAVAGTFKGPYSTTRSPTSLQGTLVLTQIGRDVTGTFATSDSRAFTVAGTVTANAVSATFTLVGGCAGSAVVEIDVRENGAVLDGAMTTSDCIGVTSGAFTLTKQ